MTAAIQKRGRWRDFRGVLRPAGAVIMGLAVAQLACALIGGGLEWWLLPREERSIMDVLGLLVATAATSAIGLASFLYGQKHATETLSRREAVLAVVVIWCVAAIFGGLPFVVSAEMSPVDALFESMSGLTTTGATVIDDIEARLSMPLLLWRSLIQWLGGMGIVVLFVAVFPSLGAGAKHMFKGEVPGTTAEGLRPRIAETSFALWKLYAGLTALEAVLLMLCGMSPFESVCHALTTMATGGFSTRDSSIAAFDSYAIDMVVATFMLLGSLNYALYYALLKGPSVRAVFRNTELRAFAALSLFFIVALTLGTLGLGGRDLADAFRRAYFMVGTTMSSTGYVTDDPMRYPPAVLGLVVLMMFIGGCAGSTAGGLKVERVVLMGKMVWAEFRQSFRPSVVAPIRMGRTAVPPEILRDVGVFVALFVGCLAFGALFVSLTDGTGLPGSFGATLTCLSNMGPWPFREGPDNFKAFSDPAKLFFTLAMMLGRLEFFTVFALLVPDFWRR